MSKTVFKLILILALFQINSLVAGERKNDFELKDAKNWKEEKLPLKKAEIILDKPLEEMTNEDFSNLSKNYGREIYIKKRSEFFLINLQPIVKKNELSSQDEIFLKNNFFAIEDRDLYNIQSYFLLAWAKLQAQKGISKSALLMLDRIPDKSLNKAIADKVYLLKGKLQFENGEYQKSITSLRKASKYIGKTTPEINHLIGCNLIKQEKFQSGISVLEETVKISNDTNLLIDAYNNIAIALFKTNQPEQAVANFQKAIQLKGNSQEKSYLEYLKIAQSYLDIGEFEKAESFVDKFRETNYFEVSSPDEIIILKDLSKHLDSIGETQKSLSILQLHGQLTDSLFLGNKTINELYQLELLAKQKEISDNAIKNLVEEDKLKEEALSATRWAMILLIVLLTIGLGAGFYILKVSKQRRIANQQLALRSLRSQMNPHFIFNALNSVNSFISENDQRSANKFLANFSRLMRLVMENSEFNFIPLQKELEILKIYLQLEHFRFKDQFEYSIEIDENIDEDEIQLPPMLIQPYIENAIWHGLRYKEQEGLLELKISEQNKNLIVTISDNGIGRKRSSELKTANQKKNKSTALRNIKERIKIINDLHQLKIEVSIEDLNTDGTGTLVKLLIPQNLKNH